MQGLEHKTTNPLLNKELFYSKRYSKLFNIFNSDEIMRTIEHEISASQMNTRSKIKQKLRKDLSQSWLKNQNSTSDKFTQKEIEKEYQLEEYLKKVRSPTH